MCKIAVNIILIKITIQLKLLCSKHTTVAVSSWTPGNTELTGTWTARSPAKKQQLVCLQMHLFNTLAHKHLFIIFIKFCNSFMTGNIFPLYVIYSKVLMPCPQLYKYFPPCNFPNSGICGDQEGT